MNILAKTEHIRKLVKQHGGYLTLSKESGAPYEWLCKFVANRISNPGVKYVSALEDFFNKKLSP